MSLTCFQQRLFKTGGRLIRHARYFLLQLAESRWMQAGEEHETHKHASPSWGRLIAKVHQVDPLVCTRCARRVSVVAFVTDSAAVGRILERLGLSTPEAEKPPPSARELLRVAEHGDGWGVPADWE